MKDKDKRGDAKQGILRWEGTLAGVDRRFRILMAIAIVMCVITLVCTENGFLGIGEASDYSAYAVPLLSVVVLAAYLLGPVAATLTGLLSGITLFVHARFMPLDVYELTFITPVSSIVLFTVIAALIGVLFALMLRKGSRGWGLCMRIVLVCVFVSAVYSLAFLYLSFEHMLAMFTEYLAVEPVSSAEGERLLLQSVYVYLLRMGNPGVQIVADVAMMVLACVIGALISRKAEEMRNNPTIHSQFSVALLFVTLVIFAFNTVVAFGLVSASELGVARQTADTEVKYLCTQLDSLGKQGIKLAGGNGGAEDARSEYAIDLLDGYTPDVDGTIVVVDNATGEVLMSDDETIPEGEIVVDYLSEEVMVAAFESEWEDSFEHAILDRGVDANTLKELYDADDAERTTLTEAGLLSGEHTFATLAYVRSEVSGDYRVIMVMPSSLVYEGRKLSMVVATLTFLALLFAVQVLTTLLLRRLVIRRIDETNGLLARITGGDLDARMNIDDSSEFRSLSGGINETVTALQGWIAEAESRMDAELATAKAIQESALPRIFPPFPDILRFDIYASMHAAREVGGDFYDFFLIGNSGAMSGKLGFVVADVSGKGVPAALFMMNAKTLVRGYMESGVELGEAVENANRKLCEGNDAGMFVTLFAGILDYGTGHVDYVNAGHNPPLLWHDGSWSWLRDRSGLPLGLFDSAPYRSHSLDCEIGDQFLIYTDGVTEAMDAQSALYGEARLEELVQERYYLHPRELVNAVRHSVAEYAADAEQSDDITIMALEMGVPPEVTATLIVPADVEQLPRVNEFIHTELDRRLCPVRAQNQLDIAVEELFVNVANYAYPDLPEGESGVARISYTYSADPPSVSIDISDDGIPYNPLEKPDAVTPDDIMDVPVGGLGILMAKRSVDEMRYERVDGSNVVTIVKKW